MKPSFNHKLLLCGVCCFTLAAGINAFGQDFDLHALSQQALSVGAHGAATYSLYAEYLKNPIEFKDYEITAFLLAEINEFAKADSLLTVIETQKDVKELSDSLRYYYYASRATTDLYKNNYIKALNSIAQVEPSPELSELKAECYMGLGLFNQAIEVFSSLCDDFDEFFINCSIGECYRKDGQYAKAIDFFHRAKQTNPDSAFPYYGIGWSYELAGDDEMALKYYNEGLDVDKSYAYLFLKRGELNEKLGHHEEASKDFNTVLRLDKSIADGTCRQYALFFLGRKDDAMHWMNRLIEYQPNNPDHYYDKACLCCRMELYDEAIKAMEFAFQKGYREFAHLNADDDIEPIKTRPEYSALYNHYYSVYQSELEQLDGILMNTDN